LGLIYEMQGNLKKAENAYQNAGNKSALGVIYYLEGQKTKALSLIQEARSNGDNSDRLLYYSGLIYADQKEYSQAISEWEGLKRRHPEDGTIQNNISNAWFLIGWDAYQSGNLSQAVKAMENYFSSHADDEAFKLTLGQLYIQLAVNSLGSEASQDAVQRARELKFSEPTCAYIEALNALKSGNIEKGLEILKRLHQNEPDNPIISFNLGMAHIGRDQPDQAISYLQQTHKNGEAELKRLSSWALVSAHVKLGEWQEAASMIKSI